MPVDKQGRRSTRNVGFRQVAAPYAAPVASSKNEAEIVRDMANVDVSRFRYPIIGILEHINDHAIALEKVQPNVNRRNALIRGAMAEIIRRNNLSSDSLHLSITANTKYMHLLAQRSQLHNMFKSVFFNEKIVDPIRIFSTLESASIAMAAGYDFDRKAEGRTMLMETLLRHTSDDPSIVIDPAAVRAVYGYNGAERLNLRDSSNEQTAIIFAARAVSSPELMQALMDCGADASLQDVTGKNAFMYSASNGDLDSFKVLVESTLKKLREAELGKGKTVIEADNIAIRKLGKILDLADGKGERAADKAAKYGRTEIAKYIESCQRKAARDKSYSRSTEPVPVGARLAKHSDRQVRAIGETLRRSEMNGESDPVSPVYTSGTKRGQSSRRR